MSEVLRGTLHYEVDEEGLHVSQKEESALLPWKQIYKMVATKHNVLVYSSRINAYVIPRAQLGKATRHADTGCGTSAGVPFEDEVENGDFKI